MEFENLLALLGALYDPSTQVGYPAFLLIERLFYGGLAIFLFGALGRAIKRGIEKQE